MHADCSKLQTSLYACTGKNSNRVVTVVYPWTRLPFSILRAISYLAKVTSHRHKVGGWLCLQHEQYFSTPDMSLELWPKKKKKNLYGKFCRKIQSENVNHNLIGGVIQLSMMHEVAYKKLCSNNNHTKFQNQLSIRNKT